jgi:hypothetical protein
LQRQAEDDDDLHPAPRQRPYRQYGVYWWTPDT